MLFIIIIIIIITSHIVSWLPVFQMLFTKFLHPSERQVEPRFTILPASTQVVPGGSVNLTCAAYGSPMPQVRWMKAGMDLNDVDDLPLGRNVLELRGIYESANYTCVATSRLGTIDASARVTVRSKSPLYEDICSSVLHVHILLCHQYISLAESEKGITAFQQCSHENHKGIINTDLVQQ